MVDGRKSQGQDRIFGHKKVWICSRNVKVAADLKVKFLTLYAFSTENWNRPQGRGRRSHGFISHVLANELEELNENGVRLQAIGNIKVASKGMSRKS